MRLNVFHGQPLEAVLPRRVKQVLVVVMAGLILLLLLSFESGNGTPFMYLAF